MYFEQIVSALNFAWGELFDFPAQLIFKNSAPLRKDNNFTLAAFPVLGFLTGWIISAVAFLCAVIFNCAAGAVFFALGSWLVLCFKDSSREDARFGKFCSSKLPQLNNSEFIAGVMNFFPVMLKFVILLFIGLAGGIFYLPLVLASAFAVQAGLASCDDCPPGFIEYGDYGDKVFYAALIAAGLLAFIAMPLATLGAVAAAILSYAFFRKKMRISAFTADGITRAGYYTEWILLAAGLLLV